MFSDPRYKKRKILISHVSLSNDLSQRSLILIQGSFRFPVTDCPRSRTADQYEFRDHSAAILGHQATTDSFEMSFA